MVPPLQLNPRSDRRAEMIDRRRGRRGGRRLTDRRPDILHGLPCWSCDTGVLTLADAHFAGSDLELTYRCPMCSAADTLVVDPQLAIPPEVYERALQTRDRDVNRYSA